jgi:hypothetical protein
VTVLRSEGADIVQGPWVQVSRLGEPLINEVLIPLGQKDRWNRSDPEDDQQFAPFYLKPEPATLINALYDEPPVQHIDESGRTDLQTILLTGVPGLNYTGPRQMDLLRLNMAVAPTAAVGQGNPLGVLAGDLAGFPNGRRLEDDVTDIEVRAIAQGYGPFLNQNFGLPNKNPNNDIGDADNHNDRAFTSQFPYLATPKAGYDPALHVQGNPAPLPLAP